MRTKPKRAPRANGKPTQPILPRKVWSAQQVERSVFKNLEPAVGTAGGVIRTFAEFHITGFGVVIALPTGQQYTLTVNEAVSEEPPY